jgi:hypothetical protein
MSAAGRPTSISSANAPQLDIPARFMVLAMIALSSSVALAPWGYPLLLRGFYNPHLLAYVHLNTLGILATMIVGASYQLIPVVLQHELSSQRLARISFWMHLAGLLLFLPGIFYTWRIGIAAGASLVFAGLLLYAGIVLTTIHVAPERGIVAWHLRLATIGLLTGVSAGLLLALNKGTGFLGDRSLRLMAAHATMMLGAWVVPLFFGVAYRLIGMFTLSEDRIWHRVAAAELAMTVVGAWLLAAGILLDAPRFVLVLGAMLILGGQLLFATQVVHLFRARRRRGFDIHIPYVLLAAGSGVLSASLLLTGLVIGSGPAEHIWVAAVWMVIGGLALSGIQGFFYKITTFLVWLHRYAPMAGRDRVPRLEQMYSVRLAKVGVTVWSITLVLLATAILAGSERLIQVAGVCAVAGVACFLGNVARIASHAVPRRQITQQRGSVASHGRAIGKG